MTVGRKLLLAISLLSIAGAIVASVSLYHHYGRETSSYCDFGQSFNCDIVNRSIYSEIAGIPVALVGLVGYLALLGLATIYRTQPETPKLLLAASLGGLGFALYLTYVEAFILDAWCILCLSSLAAISGIAVLSAVLFVRARRARTG